MDRREAHEAMETHLPVQRRFRIRCRCQECGEWWPCPARVAALDELEGVWRTWWKA